jgi:hypothetical protein
MSRWTKHEPQNHQGKTNTWLTPLSLINSLGEFDLDPCGFIGHKTAKKIVVLPKDGLSIEWNGRVWLNPPYGRNVNAWLQKLQNHGNGMALVFGRTDVKWFQNLRFDGINFLSKRIAFLNDKFEQGTNAGVPSVLIAFGENNLKALHGLDGRIFESNGKINNASIQK